MTNVSRDTHRDLAAFLALKFYPGLMDSVGLNSLLVFNAAVCGAAAIAAFFLMPETLGLSLTELNRLFHGKSKTEKSKKREAEEEERASQISVINVDLEVPV